MRKLTFIGMAVAGLLLFALPALAVPSPIEQLKRSVNEVLDVLRDKSQTGQPRREKLSKLIRARFDFNIMSQRTLGKYWKDATPQDQARFIALYSDLLEASYIGRIEAYTDETVHFTAERIDGDSADVDSYVHAGNVDIPINYRLVLAKDQWLVYDVIIEEVSLIRNFRNSYGEIVRKEGYAGLFKRMEEKIRELRSQNGDKGGKG